MDKITSALLDQFSREYEIEKLKESVRFEHFAGFATIRRHYSRSFDPCDVVTGSGGDTGIDVIAIIVNNVLVTDVDTVASLADQNGYVEAVFIFVQAERSDNFDGSKIGDFGTGVRDFFSDKPKQKRNQKIKDAAEIMSAVYNHVGLFRRRPSCALYYVTTGTWKGDGNLTARRDVVVDDLQKTKIFDEIEFSCFGSDEIQRAYNQTKNPIVREILFSNRTDVPETPGVTQAFLGFIPFSAFLKLVSDESGSEILGSIFYDNVRDWQEYNPVNKEIRATLESDDRSRFVLMNNGITVIARSITAVNQRFTLEDFQIVNGCQTSHVIFDQRDSLDDTVCIPLRLIETKDEAVTEAIIHATNNQTALKPEQLYALLNFSKKLEAFYQAYEEPYQLYYERRDGQYDRQTVEKTRIITPANTIRSFAAVFLNEPHRTTRDFKALRSKVGNEIFGDNHRLEPYYASSYAWYRLDFLWRNLHIPNEYKPARYHILLAVRLMIDPAPLSRMNSHEMERRANKFISLLHDSENADQLFREALGLIDEITDGNLDRDHVRTLPVTNALLNKFGLEGTSA